MWTPQSNVFSRNGLFIITDAGRRTVTYDLRSMRDRFGADPVIYVEGVIEQIARASEHTFPARCLLFCHILR